MSELVAVELPRLLASAGTVRALESRPHLVLMHPEVWAKLQAMQGEFRARYERLRRKPLLSGRYQKRRRQRAQGVVGQRYERLQIARLAAQSCA